ncbi:MAG: PAS domain-containing protein, partial [Veillonella sp.]|nr:PAS domain-containing protein [Veillonella sp.]
HNAMNAELPETQEGASVPHAFLQDLAALVGKYTTIPGQAVSPTTEVNLNTGSMTLEQVNLMLKALPVDITYVDEEELVRYFNDTSARIFPRSPNVIGRDVMNCHPAQSRDKVREVFDKFRAGLEDQAEAFIDKPGLFVYIIYVAVRDENGRFRGILEMVQDCTRIRAFSSAGRPGRQVIWGSEIGGPNDPGTTSSESSTESAAVGGVQGASTFEQGHVQGKASAESDTDEAEERDEQGDLIISAKTKMSALIKQYPGMVDYMISLSPNYAKLKSPLAKVMMKVATLDMVAGRGGYSTDELVEKIKAFIEKQK